MNLLWINWSQVCAICIKCFGNFNNHPEHFDTNSYDHVLKIGMKGVFFQKKVKRTSSDGDIKTLA